MNTTTALSDLLNDLSSGGARAVTRRNALAGLGLGSLSMAVAPTLFRSSPAPGKAHPKPKRVKDSNGNLVQPGPYTVQASCMLTEDYFLTDDVLIDLDGGDEIIPFTTQDGTIEALVLTGVAAHTGQLNHFKHDPASPSGWTYTQIDTGLTNVTSASVASYAGQIPIALVSGDPGFLNERRNIVELVNGTWNVTHQTFGAPGKNRAGIAWDQSPYFYVTTTSTEGSTLTVDVTLYTPNYLDGVDQAFSWHWDGASGVDIGDLVMIYDPDGKNGWVVMYSEISGAGRIDQFAQSGPTNFSTAHKNVTAKATALLGAYGDGKDPAVDILWQDTQGEVTVTRSAPAGVDTLQLGLTAGVLSTDAVATWKHDNAYTFVVVINETAQVVAQQPGESAALAYYDVVPLLAGVGQVFSVATDLTQSTLFAVDVDSSLSVLTSGPTGWTQTLAHRDAATMQEVTSWRCQVTMQDTNALGVANGSVQLSTDRPVALWQETTATMLTPGHSQVMTCDETGRLVFAIPATELDTAVLTAQPLDANRNAYGKPLVITPDTDVSAFLQGTGALDDVGELTGSVLLAAQNTTWNPATQSYTGTGALLPVLAAVPPGQQPDVAKDMAAAMNHIATLPTFQPASGGTQSALLDLGSAAPAFTTSTDPNHFNDQLNVDKSWWAEVKNEAETAYHGLRHGAISLRRLVSSWDSSAQQWTLSLVVTIGDKVEHLLQFVVTAAEHAIHAISAFVHALGADIRRFWNWLKNEVLGLISAAEKNAKVMEGWLGQLTDQLHTQMTTIGVKTTGYFSNLEAKAHSEISTLAGMVELDTFGSAAPLPPPTDNTGSSDADLLFKDAEDAIKFMRHCSGQWLLTKLMAYLPSVPSDGGPSPDPSVGQVLPDVITDFEAEISVIEDVYDLIEASAKMMDSASGFNQANMGTWFTDLDQTVHDSLQLLDDLAHTIIDLLNAAIASIEDLLGYRYQAVPLIGDLLELAGIDTTVSIKHLVSLIIAYPTTLIHNLAVGGPLFPGDTAQGREALSSGVPDPWGAAINWTSGVTQAIWAFNDGYEDCIDMANFSNGTKDSAPSFTTYIDIVCPLILGILQWPSAQVNNLTQPPFSAFPSDSEAQALCPFIVVTGVIPALVGIFGLGVSKDQDPNETFDNYVQPWVQTVAGLANGVLGGVQAWHEKSTNWDKAEGILGNISYVIAPARSKYLAEESQGVSLLIKAIVDAIGNFGACYPMFNDALTASGL
jgi:hypothetical protein